MTNHFSVLLADYDSEIALMISVHWLENFRRFDRWNQWLMANLENFGGFDEVDKTGLVPIVAQEAP